MKPMKLAATVGSSTTGQVRLSGLAAPIIPRARSAASAPIAAASRAPGPRPIPNPSPVSRDSPPSAIACRYA